MLLPDRLGGRLLVVPYLLGRGLVIQHAVAHSTALNLLVSTGGLLALWLLSMAAQPAACDPVLWLLAGSIAVGAVAAAPTGLAWSQRLPVALLRCVFGVITLLAGAAVLLRL